MIGDLLDDATAEQRAAIAYDGGNAYVGAGPGTGKTYLLIDRYRTLRARGIGGDKILILTFSRRAVLDLRERLEAAGFPATNSEVRTFHGFAARVIGGGVPSFRDRRLLDGFSREVVLDAAIARAATAALSAGARTSRAFRTEVSRLLDDLGRAEPATLHAVVRDASPRLRDVFGIHAAATAVRATIGGSDIGDLVSRAVTEARRPDSRAARWLLDRYTHVLIDEFQDTDRVQLDLLACLGAAVFAVGDEAQSIYRFRGASDDVVTEAIARFRMRRFDLTISRRCPPDVCAVASRAPIPNMVPLRSVHPDGARVAVVRLRALDDEVAYLADAIEADLNAGVAATDIAVLLRAFRPLGPLLVDELGRRGIAVTSTGREELLADPRIGTLRAALDVLDRPSDAQRWMRLLTASPLGFDPIAIRFAGESVRQLRLDDALPEALGALCREGALSGAALADGLLDAAHAWRAGDLGTAARHLARRLRLRAALIAEERPSGIRAAGNRLKLVCDALAAAQRTARALDLPATCADMLARFEEFLPSLALDDAGLDTQSAGVRVLTVHAAKGLEFERVFIADAVQGRFPQDARPSTLVTDADRALLLQHRLDGPSIVPDGAAREEASLWFVAVTRSKSRLTISFADQGLNGDLQRPSRFLDPERVPLAARPVDRESLLVRVLHDRVPGARDRLLAGGALQRAPATEDFARAGAAAFVPVDGRPLVLARPLGVGDAELWLQCPRRLFYKKFAKLPDEESAALALGSALHAVLERFHAKRTAFDGTDTDAGAWERELVALRREIWEPDRFESPTVADAAARAADVALRGYARALIRYTAEHPCRVELREKKIEVPVGRFALSGKVDRVDEWLAGPRVVLDYKSGHARSKTLAHYTDRLAKQWVAADAENLPRKSIARRATKELKLQLALYATAFDAIGSVGYVFLGGEGSPPKRNGAIFELLPFTGSLVDVTRAALDEVEHELLEPLDAAALRYLPVTYDEESCTFCPYVSVCPGPAEDPE